MTDDAVPVFADATPRIRRVSVDRPWTWLAAGWRDVLAAPGVSLAYGALMVALTYLLLLVLVQVGVFTALRGNKNVACLRKAEQLVARLQPSEFVIEAFDEGSGKHERIRHLSLDLVAMAADRGLFVESYARETVQAAFEVVGARTREEVAGAVARFFPALAYRLPEPRKPWNSQDKRIAIFNAAAVVLTHFHNGATALLKERNAA